MIKKLWFVNAEAKRMLVWALTPSGYALAGERLGRTFKVPRHDVASQFLEHATNVSELYVALTKRLGPAAPARRGKPADDFARLPTAVRWVPSEDLELPFKEYDRAAGGVLADRRLQPDAMLEDPARRVRYFIEFETGSATVRNDVHKTATLTKLRRYSNFLLSPTNASGSATSYSAHFPDGYRPSVVFLTKTAARRDTIRDAARDRSSGLNLQVHTLPEAVADFRRRLVGDLAQSQPQAVQQSTAAPERAQGLAISRQDLDILQRVHDEALYIIQSVRHTVRAGRPVTGEPPYPRLWQAAEVVLKRLAQDSKP